MERTVKSTRSATSFIIISFVAVFVGLAASLSLIVYVLLLIVSVSLLFLILNRPERSVYIYTLLIFVPICTGKYLGHEVLISYLLIPIVMVLYLFQKIVNNVPIYSFQWRLNPLLVPILIYFLVVFVNFLRNPPSLAGLEYRPQGFHAWFRYLLSFCSYFIFAEVVATDMKITQRAVKFLWRLCFSLSVLGVILIYSYSAQNILSNLENYGVFYNFFGGMQTFPHYRLPGGGYRIGTLGGVASIGLILLLARTYKVKNIWRWVLGGFLTYSLILAGGRSGFGGIMMALLVWMIIIEKKARYYVMSLTIFLFLYLSVFVFYEIIPGSLQRIFNIFGSFRQLDYGRSLLFPVFLESSLRHPILGVGIGSIETSWEEIALGGALETYIVSNLRLGGHGTYISILYLMGLAGFIPFAWGLIKGLKCSYSLSKRNNDKLIMSLAIFCFLWLIYYLIPMALGGTGSDMFYFAIMGIISGLCIRQKIGRKVLKRIGK